MPFRPCMDARSKSPASAHGLDGRSPASAKWGGLLFGYFLLATQEKVTRPPQEGESSGMAQQEPVRPLTPTLSPMKPGERE